MNPVIGLDFSKGKSDGQVFLDKGQPFGHPFCIQHNQDGLRQLLDVITNVQLKLKRPRLLFWNPRDTITKPLSSI